MAILFWIVVCLDVACMLFFFVLGLAFAGPSHTNPLLVALYMLVIPGLFLGGAIFLFFRSWRAVALLIAAAPMLVAIIGGAISAIQLGSQMDSNGAMTFFGAGPMRELSTAISKNDTATVAALLPKVNVNQPGYQDTTLLILALRQMRTTPEQQEVFRMLLKAGADPNIAAGGELPLELAFQVSEKTGPEPVLALLKAGAKVNTINQFGTPVYYNAIGKTMPIEVLQAVLANGADPNAKGRQGQTALTQAVNVGNWQALLVLLERGHDFKQPRMLDGSTIKDKIESHRRNFGDEPGIKEVLEFMEKH